MAEHLKYKNIIMLPVFNLKPAQEVREMAGIKEGVVNALDFSVDKAELQTKIKLSDGEIAGYYFEEERLRNFDHHAPTIEMTRMISTTPLVRRWVLENGAVTEPVIVNHFDADSALSSLLLIGELDAKNAEFERVAIAADHTGEDIPMAELLNELGNTRDMSLVITNLKALLNGSELTPEGQQAIETRKRKREEVKKLVNDGTIYQAEKGLWWGVLEKDIPMELLPGLLPEAEYIFMAMPFENGWAYKGRLGIMAPVGTQINTLGLPNFNGRWNAGGTKRHGAVDMRPDEYLKEVVKIIYHRD